MVTTWWDGLAGRVLLAECQQVNAKKKSSEGALATTEDGLEFSGKKADRVLIPWDEITDMQVNTAETSRITAGRLLTIGVFALAAKKKEQFTVVEIETQFSTFAYMASESQSSVIDVMRPLISALKSKNQMDGTNVPGAAVPQTAPVAVAGPSIADQIRELGALRDEGLLTEEEFAEKKARLLG